jgi:glucose-1-phosphate thymidylyltransferase
VKVTYIPQSAPLGLAHAVKISEDFLGTDSFVMYLGDNLIRSGITGLVDEFRRESPNCQILLAHVDHPQDFGVAELEGDTVVRLEEKPKVPKSDLALVGVYMFDHHVFEAVKAIRPSFRNELEITDAIQYLIDRKLDVRSHIITGWWKDTGKLEDMLEANRIVLMGIETETDGAVLEGTKIDGNVIVGKGSRIVRSTLRGPLIIGEDCVVEDSYVGPFSSLHDRVVVRECEVEHSIVLEGSSLVGIGRRVEGSLIGRGVSITRAPALPRVYRFMVGDQSRIEVSG